MVPPSRLKQCERLDLMPSVTEHAWLPQPALSNKARTFPYVPFVVLAKPSSQLAACPMERRSVFICEQKDESGRRREVRRASVPCTISRHTDPKRQRKPR